MPHVQAAGVNTFYLDTGRRRGTAPTVALLHGGLSGGSTWQPVLPRLIDEFRVLVPDRRGHGRTADVPGPFTYPAMAAETVAFLEQLGDPPTHLVGYSDGGIVALHVARQRPDLVASVVAVCTNFHVDGLLPEIIEQMAAFDPDEEQLGPLRDAYGAENPDGADHFAVMAAKVSEMGATGPTLTTADLSRIECPVLVIAADGDIVRPEHTLAMVEAIPTCRLAVIPSTSHMLPEQEPQLMMDMIHRFLDGVIAGTVTPVQRGW